MAAVPCSKCTAERKGFRRELDSWRYKLIHCVDCEPDEVADWSPEVNSSHCSFCNLPLEKLIDQAPATASPLSSPSDFSPCQAPVISESCKTAHKFLQAVFHKKDVSQCCDANIPRIAQELMKKMIHQFAMEYASKCLLHTTSTEITRTSTPFSEAADAPLDLTVSQTLGETERVSEPDGVLDLSKKNTACSTSSTSLSDVRASGWPSPSDKEETSDIEQKKHYQQSALGVVLSPLCPAHRSLLYRMLKLAHEENLLPFPVHKPAIPTETHCCHCRFYANDDGVLPKWKALNRSSTYPSPDCHQGCESRVCHPRDFPLIGCKSISPLDLNNSCRQSCRMDTYTLVCPKRLHCTSSQGLPTDHINNTMCSFSPCSSVCCKNHPHPYLCATNHTCVTPLKIAKEDCEPPPVLKRENSPSPPPLSPIPSNIGELKDEIPPSLLHHKQEEESFCMVKVHPGGNREVIVNAGKTKDLDFWTQKCSQTEMNPRGTSIQDVMNRFSEKLDTIKPPEKDPVMPIGEYKQEQLQFSSNGQNFQFPADAHLTEIITTVLHTRNASDYNLSELFNRHDSKDPKSPNTRLRRRQEVLAAMATPADGSTTRRQNLQIKRELAMLDVSYNRRKSSQAKSSQSKDANGAVNTYCILLDSNVIPGEERETESDMDCQTVKGVPLKMITADSNTNEVAYGKTEGNMEREIPVGENDQTNIMTRDLQGKSCNHSQDDNDQSYVKTQCDRHCQKDSVICDAPIHENAPSGQICGTDGVDNGPVEDPSHINNTDDQKSTSNESRRSRRNIVPPKRFSSYVIETRKMLFAACFSESIFNQKNPNNVYTSTTSDALLENADFKDSVLESIGKSTHLPGEFKSTNRENNRSPHIESDKQNQDMSQTLPVKAKPLEKLESHPSRPLGFNTASRRLQYTNVGVTTRSATCAKNVCIPPLQYTSPIKLMFVSPLKDKEGIIYSLKSVRSGSNGQAEEPFDPCKESSWAGTPEKDQSQKTECTTPHIRSNRKSTTSPDKSDQPSTNRSPLQKPKCGSSPAKPLFSTPKSASAPPKLNSSSFESAPSPVKSGRSSTGSGSSPVKPTSSSPKSTPGKTTSPKSSSPKIGLKRSDEVTPSKNKFGTENQRPPGDLQSFHEVTPLKRRPGRPKKLGPHLEKKVKRPIGRPRKQKPEHEATETRANEPADMEGKANRNLKITVIYGRSRRNKRLVSESFDQLQTEFRDACRAAGLKDDLSVTKISQIKLCHAKLGSPESHEGIHYANIGPEAALQPSWKIKSQNREKNLPARKPGRPAKVKISGISVTITTLSPKQRKILIEKDSSNTRTNKKALLPDFQSAKEPRTVNCQPVSTNLQPEEQRESQSKSAKKVFTQPSAVRHSNRVSKPSMYFLHAVATSTTRTYRHSNALLRRSKQLLLNKACNVRKLEKQNSMGDLLVKGHHREQEHKNIHQYLNQVADISVDSIFAPKETLRWWAASAEEQTLNQELARRIQLISNTWVSDALEKQTFQIKEHNEGTSSPGSNSKHSSVVQTLFNCLPAEPRSCSMQQLSSWFMETTETQSLDIVKRKSSRNRYEVMHLPRAVNKQGVKCQSPQAERLHRHLKKFAKTLPKSPVQHQKAQKRLAKTKEALSIHNLRQRLFTHKSVRGSLSQGLRRCQHLSKYQATLLRVRRRFLPQKERKWAKKRNIQETASGPEVVIGRKTKLLKSRKYKLFKSLENRSESQFEEPVGVPKEQNICSKAWSSETLKECRVFLKKINSPGNKSAEELNSCTVTLDDKSASAFVFAGKKRQLVGVVQAVKRKRRTHGMLGSAKLTDSARNSLQKLDELPLGSQKGKCPGLVSAEPPPAKKLRQSRMKGLSGPRWCDFVIGS
ncbi:uncharacterized protein lcorl isoform X2 [Corythoichthys intestinalis]|uniref:uncharacterized protein lcorl isoform X2 n=1 Tax=Corythoichthys intestinalis TaxID=161448 RepID=UPI0025A5B287|nr:uncharacterized protein lcorl isoform X2 [Corythoichthys intestinalis]